MTSRENADVLKFPRRRGSSVERAIETARTCLAEGSPGAVHNARVALAYAARHGIASQRAVAVRLARTAGLTVERETR